MMWSAPPLRQWSPCFLANYPVAMCLPTGVPTDYLPVGTRKNFRLHWQLRNFDLDNDSTTGIGNLGKAVVKSGTVSEQNKKKLRAKHRQEEEEEEEKKLSGFDVLQALERATSQKMKKKNKERDVSLLSRKGSVRGRRNDEASAASINVRPLSIKEDWGSRLDELETRLQQLLHTTGA